MLALVLFGRLERRKLFKNPEGTTIYIPTWKKLSY